MPSVLNLIFAIATLALCGCVTSRDDSGTTASVGLDRKGHNGAIVELREKWLTSLKTKNLEASLALYMSDAEFLPPTGEHVVGRAAIRRLFKTVMQTFDSKLILTSRSLAVSGEIGYESGEYHETLIRVATGERQNIKGQYVMIVKRRPDGGWKIARHIWTEVSQENG